ncbi:MAG TPA: hypothetical protein VMV40_09145 [Acidiferrobacter sp.]|nr:hypothetical protein [Acidiferrobacter sp.]
MVEGRGNGTRGDFRDVARVVVVWSWFVAQACGVVPVAIAGYRLGGGESIGNFNLAGYSSIVFSAPHGSPNDLTLEGLSLFAFGHQSRYVNPFLEAEIENAQIAPETHSGKVAIERLYNDFNLSSATTLRAGKMLTPVGDWNLTHAAPLVWTVTRPLATYYSFPVFVTGAALRFQRPADVRWDAQFYVQPGRDAFAEGGDYEPYQYSQVAGFNVHYGWDPLNRLGLSVQTASIEQSGGASQILGSFYGEFTTGPAMWEFQANFTDIHGGTFARVHNHEEGGFLQAVYPLTDHWFAVGQGEIYQTQEYVARARRWAVGVVYRPRTAISWKLEYLDAKGPPVGEPTGVYAAFAVLF